MFETFPGTRLDAPAGGIGGIRPGPTAACSSSEAMNALRKR